jgi:hypothetical protein
MAIVTSKFRVSAASGFASTFSTDRIYMVFGRPQSWDNALSTTFTNQGSGTITDNNPPNPVDNYLNEYAFWRDAMAGVRLNYSDVKLATVRYNWQSGTRYDMYRHNISSADGTETGVFDLSDTNFIVYVTSTGCVYKCLYNGRNGSLTTGVVSTAQPTTTGTAPQKTADGYVWKYLYTITAAEADFVTANYIPVPTTSSISNINGIDVIYVTSPGSGYSSAPVIAIFGDGTGAAAVPITSAGVITRVDVTNAGSGYTWAKVVISGGGTPTTANAVAVIAPVGGHGSNLIYETMAHNVMIAGTVTGYEQNDFPVNQDFRTIGLVKNPLVYSSSIGYTVTSTGSVYTGNTGRITRTLTMNSTTAPSNDLTITGAALGVGIPVFQSSTTTSLTYIQPVNAEDQNSISVSRIDTTGTKKLYPFVSGETLTAAGYSQIINGITTEVPEISPYSGQMIYLDYRQPVTRSAGQNEKINIVINF